MSGRASHNFIKRKCEEQNCCSKQDGFTANDLDIDTKVNVIRKRVRASCCFSTPGDICNYYGGTGCSGVGDVNPSDTFFVTHPDHPSVTATPLPLSSLGDGAVFRIESFVTTNRGGFRDFASLTGAGADPDIDAQQNVEEPFDVVILRRDAMASSGLITAPSTKFIVDTPMETLNGTFALGSFDFVLAKIFETFDGVHMPIQIGTSHGASSGFLSLTNPNEFEFGTPSVLQIIWSENIDWALQFVGPNNKRYMYSAISRKNHPSGVTQCTVTETDLNVTPNTTIQLGTFQCSQAWAVPCNPVEYITCRHKFDMNFPVSAGCAGTTDGVVCIDEITIENFVVRLRKDCLCDAFEDDTGITGVAGPTGNHIVIVNLLNKAFENSPKTKGWKALPDLEYGYIRIVHPDNILFWNITLTKNFFNGSTPQPACIERQRFQQGGQTIFTKPNDTFDQVTTTSNQCILDGLCWCAESDMRGCVLLE